MDARAAVLGGPMIVVNAHCERGTRRNEKGIGAADPLLISTLTCVMRYQEVGAGVRPEKSCRG